MAAYFPSRPTSSGSGTAGVATSHEYPIWVDFGGSIAVARTPAFGAAQPRGQGSRWCRFWPQAIFRGEAHQIGALPTSGAAFRTQRFLSSRDSRDFGLRYTANNTAPPGEVLSCSEPGLRQM